MTESKKKVVIVIAPKNYRDEEYFKPRVVLMSHGIEMTTAAKYGEESTGTLGGKAKIALTIDQINSHNYDGIVLVGGTGAEIYFKDKKLHKIVKEFFDQHKVLGAICIAPSILANAGVLKGKKATCFLSEKKNLQVGGADYINKGVVIDGKTVTAQGPDFAQEFGEAVAKVLT